MENLAPVMAAKKIEICRIQSYRGKLLLFCGIAIGILVWGYGAIFVGCGLWMSIVLPQYWIMAAQENKFRGTWRK